MIPANWQETNWRHGSGHHDTNVEEFVSPYQSAFCCIFAQRKKFLFENRTGGISLGKIKDMETVQLPATRTARPFPETAIVATLGTWWAAEIDAANSDPFAPPAGTLADALPAIDSLTVMRLLILIETLIGFELPVSVVKRGGYGGLDEMINHLVGGVRTIYNQKHP